MELSTYTQSELNFFIFTLHKNEFNVATIHGYINTAHGNISNRRVREIFDEFWSGVWTSLEIVGGSGRLQSSSSDANVAWVKKINEASILLNRFFFWEQIFINKLLVVMDYSCIFESL